MHALREAVFLARGAGYRTAAKSRNTAIPDEIGEGPLVPTS